MTQRLTQAQQALKDAIGAGYAVTPDGVAVSPSGKVLSVPKNARYPRFNIYNRLTQRPVGVSVARLCAFQRYGAKIFEPEMRVGHLDSNSRNNRPDNVIVGTTAEIRIAKLQHHIRLHQQDAPHVPLVPHVPHPSEQSRSGVGESPEIARDRISLTAYKNMRAILPGRETLEQAISWLDEQIGALDAKIDKVAVGRLPGAAVPSPGPTISAKEALRLAREGPSPPSSPDSGPPRPTISVKEALELAREGTPTVSEPDDDDGWLS